MSASVSEKKPRVLVIRGGAVGDFILTLPAIQLLRDHIAGAHIEVLGYAPIISLAKAGGLADEIRSLEHASMARLFVPNAEIDPALKEYLCSFNLVVSYLYDPDGYFKGNLERLGVKTLIEMPHRVEPDKGHAAEQLAQPLQKLAMFLDDPAPRLTVTSSSVRTDGMPLVAVHTGSGSLLKNWPLDRWIVLLNQLLAENERLRFALIAGEAEHERGMTGQLRQAFACQSQRVLFWDSMTLVELAAQLSAATAFLGHDSGISHLAAACHIPCLLLFGPTDPDVWAPKNPRVQILSAPEGELRHLTLNQIFEEASAFLNAVTVKN